VPRGKAVWNANGGFVSVLLTHLLHLYLQFYYISVAVTWVRGTCHLARKCVVPTIFEMPLYIAQPAHTKSGAKVVFVTYSSKPKLCTKFEVAIAATVAEGVPTCFGCSPSPDTRYFWP